MEIINKSKSYLLPLLDDFMEIKHVGSINNTYLFLEGKEDEYIIIQYNKVDTVKDYIEEIRNHKIVIDIVETSKCYYVIIIPPDDLMDDYHKFLKGKFSEISGKDRILKFLSRHYTSRHFQAIQRIKQVLYRDRALKAEMEYSLDIVIPDESELSSIPSKITETLIL